MALLREFHLVLFTLFNAQNFMSFFVFASVNFASYCFITTCEQFEEG